VLSTTPGRRYFAGVQDAWDAARTDDIRAGLQAMRVSGMRLRQQAYQALHDLVAAGYFEHPAAWKALGYPGPRAV
jgi:hypothetical protein